MNYLNKNAVWKGTNGSTIKYHSPALDLSIYRMANQDLLSMTDFKIINQFQTREYLRAEYQKLLFSGIFFEFNFNWIQMFGNRTLFLDNSI